MNNMNSTNKEIQYPFNQKSLKIKLSFSDRLFVAFLTCLSIIFFAIFAIPVIKVIVSSLVVTDITTERGIRFTVAGYRGIFKNRMVFQGFKNSILYTTVGTLISIIATVLSAYVLSRPDFRMASFIRFLFIFTNYFSGGFIPTYLLVKKLGLLNSMWSLIFPSAISVYNLFLLESYFRNKIPSEFYDAARIDGCGHWKYLLKIVLPFSMSYIGVIIFFFAVSYWNAYFNASIYITEMDKLPLTNILNELLIKNRESLALQSGVITDNSISLIQQVQLMEYVLIVIDSAPMIILLFIIRKIFKNQDLMGGVKM